MKHGRAVALMVVVTLMWATAGVVTRQLEQARSFEVTFWRSTPASSALRPSSAPEPVTVARAIRRARSAGTPCSTAARSRSSARR